MATVLVIDDDPQIRRLTARILTDLHHEVIEAGDGRQGLRLVLQQRPAMVLTDILMPEKEGIELIRDIRREAPGVHIIAMSGGGTTAKAMMFLDFALALGADAVLRKPFRAAELADAVTRVLGN